MQPQLNHLIVPAGDKHESARFLAGILGLDPPLDLGYFVQVETGNGVAIDFAGNSGEITPMHLAFLVTEREFDEVFGRIQQHHVSYWADPAQSRPGEINGRDGGRGVYFADPDDHLWEILTRPYGSGPVDAAARESSS
jgi:catechol 2,3-dioxygenase-like lactoylglutathione lyase family enzyme